MSDPLSESQHPDLSDSEALADESKDEESGKEQPYKYMVRLPPSMRDQLRESARYYRRSMNMDIVARLQQSFSGIPDGASVRDLEPPMQREFETLFRRELSEEEEELIRTFRRLSGKKREALRNLLS